MVIAQERLVVNPSVVAAELDDEAVLLNVETGVYFGLDALGNQIWGLLSRGVARDQILAELLAEYDVEPERLRKDLTTFLGALRDKGLIRIEEE
jgi:hypothetical protein